MSPTTPDIAHPGAAFRRGFVDALPICLGYFGVGFAIAAAAVAGGHPVWSPILQSLTHVSGTSQGAFSHRAIPGPPGGGWELFLLCVGLNLRYVLLALALAQRLPEKIGLGRRLLAACTVTDENVALAVSRPFALSFPYLAGVFASSYLGWNAGNALGAVGTSLLPASALAPLGNPETLRNFALDHGVLTWLDGELDVAPEWLFDHGQPIAYPAVSVPPLSVAESGAAYDKPEESAPPPSP